ncbi:MAG: hypothetical protein NT155_01785 [Candidatus Staskawiczbacteria bacterium]|nr:hypothetical protein [Candidatus Staskawiczbacteria bacterium]
MVKKIVKKSIEKIAKKDKEGKLIGKITHYFSEIEVAVIDLSAPLKVGDTIRVVGGQETDFEQEVESLQIDHEKVKSGKKGDGVGMKIKEKVHEGYRVFKI